MKNLKFLSFLLIGLAVAFFVFSSCQSSGVNPANANQFNSDIMAVLEGSNYSVADDGDFSIAKDQRSNILRGDFKFNDKKINFEIYRGQKIPEIIKKLNPDFPEYEVDVRLLDKNGFPFFIQVGGHSPANRDWATLLGIDANKTRAEISANAKESFSLARKMVKSLAKVRFKNDFSPEYEAIIGIKSIIEPDLKEESFKSGNNLRGGYVDFMLQIWKKQAFFPGNILGDHSGTVFRIYTNGVPCQMWSASNHGTPPGGPGMSLGCSAWFPNRLGFSQAPPMCSTPMQWDQSDWWNDDGRHVCNDDTYIQYQRVRDDINPNTTSGTCSDNTLRRYAPGCW